MTNYSIQEDILDAVISCRRKDFYNDLQMTQVAALVGVSVRTVNRYYPDKEKLICMAAFKFQSDYYNSRIAEFENTKDDNQSGKDLLIGFLKYLKNCYQQDKEDTVFLGRAALRCMQYGYMKEFDVKSVRYNLKDYMTGIFNKGKDDGSIKNTLDTEKSVMLIASTFGGIFERLAVISVNLQSIEIPHVYELFDEYFIALNDILGV